MTGMLHPTHWLIVGVVVLIFLLLSNGSRKLPEIARGLGRGARIFKSEFHELKNEDAQRTANVTEEPQSKIVEENSKYSQSSE